MAKAPELLDVANLLTAATALNTNNSRIAEAFANTISRDGSTPNSMGADLDMNSNDLLNVGELNTQDLTIRGEPITALLDGAVEESEASALAALEAKNKAQEWAENPEDDPVLPDQFSALHWAAKAEKDRLQTGQDRLQTGQDRAEVAAIRDQIPDANGGIFVIGETAISITVAVADAVIVTETTDTVTLEFN